MSVPAPSTATQQQYGNSPKPITLPPISGMTGTDFRAAVAQGGHFIIYQYCISVLVVTFKRSSPIFYVGPGESATSKGASYTLISLLAGWWGIPWGPIWTLTAVVTNLSGGKDVTREVLASVGFAMPGPALVPARQQFLSPVEAAAREDRKNLIMKLAWVAVALLFLGMALFVILIMAVGLKK